MLKFYDVIEKKEISCDAFRAVVEVHPSSRNEGVGYFVRIYTYGSPIMAGTAYASIDVNKAVEKCDEISREIKKIREKEYVR